MRVSRGKASNLAVISKFINSYLNLSQTHIANGSDKLIKLRLFSSFDCHSFNGQLRNYSNYGYNGRKYDDYDDNNSRFSGSKGRNPSAQKNFRGSREERQMPQFRPKNDYSDRNDRRRGRNDGYRKPLGGDKYDNDGNKVNMKSDDGFSRLNGNDGDTRSVNLGRVEEGKEGSNPSVSELLNKTARGEQMSKKEGEFLEKFKLGEVGKEESAKDVGASEVPSQEEKMEEPQNADEIFKKMKQSGLIPNAVAMLDGLCKDGLVQEAMKLFGLMREKGSMPEVVVYTAVVEGFCQAQQFDDAKRIFRKMQSNGIVPNAFSYTVLIKGLCKGKLLDDAVDFCLEMLENGHSPNVVTFTGLVHEFCTEKGVGVARSIILTLQQKGFLLDEKAVRTYLDKNGPKSSMVWEAIFGPKKMA